jgi:hypothetical protein
VNPGKRAVVCFAAIFLSTSLLVGCGEHLRPTPDAKTAMRRFCEHKTAATREGALARCENRYEIKEEGLDVWYIQAKPSYRPPVWFVYSVRKSDGEVKEDSAWEWEFGIAKKSSR